MPRAVIAIIFASFLSAQDQNSVAGSLSGTLGATFAGRSELRIVARISGLSPTTGTRRVPLVMTGGPRLRIEASTNTLTADAPSAYSDILSIPLQSNADVIVRWQYKAYGAEKLFSLTIWTPDGKRLDHRQGALQTVGTFSVQGAAEIGHGGGGAELCGCTIAYLRYFSTVVDEMTDDASNVAGGDLLDFEFANSLAGTGTGALTLTGTPTYSTTPASMPMREWFTIRAGIASSFSAASVAASSYLWRLVGAQTGSVLTGETTATPTLHGTTRGDYTLSLTATDSAARVMSRTIHVGAVPTNSAGVVVPASTTERVMLGEVLSAAVPTNARRDWNRFEASAIYAARQPALWIQDFETPTGTATFTNGSTTATSVTGTFKTGSGMLCNGTEEYLAVTHSGVSPTGYLYFAPFGACTDATLTLSEAFTGVTGTYSYQRQNATAGLRWAEGIGYYEGPLTLWAAWRATGLDRFRQYARDASYNAWRAPQIEQGRRQQDGTLHTPPRRASLTSLVFYALDIATENPTRSAAILAWAQSYTTNICHDGTVGGTLGLYIDRAYPTSLGGLTPDATWIEIREAGYCMAYMATMAMAGADAGIRAAWLARGTEALTNFVRAWQCRADNIGGRCTDSYSAGAWRQPDALWTGKGALPFHNALVHPFLEAWRSVPGFTATALIDTILNDSATILRTGKTATGAGPDLFLTTTGYLGRACNTPQYWAWATPGGSSDANGNNTDGATCTTDEAMRINRTLNNEFPIVARLAFARTGVSAWATWAALTEDAAWGHSDGIGGQGMALPRTTPPTDFNALDQPNVIRQIGQGALSERHAAALATGNVVTTADPVTAYVAFSLAAVTGATSIDVAVTKPDGTSATTNCTASPCAISVDRRQGSPKVRMTYRAGAPLAVGDWAPLEVR